MLIVAALGLGVAACGDEEADDQTREELVQAANAICEKYDQRFGEIEQPRNPRNTEEALNYWDEVAPVIESRYIDFSALDANDDMERDWNAYLSRQRELRDVTARVAEKVVKRDRSYINDLNEVRSVARESRQTARSIGASTCARQRL